MAITIDSVIDALKYVDDPDLKKDLVTLGMIKDVVVDGKNVAFTVVLTTPACPMKDMIHNACINAIKHYVDKEAVVNVNMTANVTSTRDKDMGTLSQVKNIIEDRIKRLKSKKDSRRRAKKTLDKNIKEFSVVAKRVAKAKKPNINTLNNFNKRFIKAAELLEKYYAQGKLTKLQYEKNLEKITKEFGG